MTRPPREILIVDNQETLNILYESPWVGAIKVYLKGGDADGGENGYVIVELYD